ncbi:hypothetical protein C8Q75DRAFT_730254 [Abortiporus biennis]|nr:hypothetical protein C8Q75DRAFT_730254 [Abortiporus biennis]
MSLQSGKYYMSSMVVDGGRKISRFWVEDFELSLGPKNIILLPASGAPKHWKPEWNIEKSADSDGYILKTSNNYTVDLEGNLVAVISPNFVPPQSWKVTAQPHHGENIYTIEAIDSPLGWVVPCGDDMTQVVLRPLINGLTVPPTYPPSELFKIEPVVD